MKLRSKVILIFLITCNLVALVSYYFLYQHIKDQTELASSLNSTIGLSQQKNSRFNSLKEVINDTADDRQRLGTFLLSGDDQVVFIEQMEALATSSGLTEKTNNVSVVTDKASGIKTFQMQIATIGDWNKTLYFLSQLQNSPYDVHIQGVYFEAQPPAKKGANPLWSALFDIGVTESATST